MSKLMEITWLNIQNKKFKMILAYHNAYFTEMKNFKTN